MSLPDVTTTNASVPNANVAASNLYATVGEYAERLKVSRGTVFGWITSGLPSFRVGRTRRIIIANADTWLENGGADRTRKSGRSRRPTHPTSGPVHHGR